MCSFIIRGSRSILVLRDETLVGFIVAVLVVDNLRDESL